jgi:hypothetical protein
LEENVCQCHFVYHESHIDWPGNNPSLHGERRLTACPHLKEKFTENALIHVKAVFFSRTLSIE